MNIFEETLFPAGRRWDYALGNVASDLKLSKGKRHAEILTKAKRLYPGALETEPFPKIGVLNLMLPVGCNASCPRICYIGPKKTQGISFPSLIDLIKQFATIGGKLIRIVGDGEPALYPHFVELCLLARELNLDVIVFTNGIGELSADILKEYSRGRLYFYVKLWSEDLAEQTALVCPKQGWEYEYTVGQYGLAPKPFYQLHKVDPNKVGFQVMTCSLNEKSAKKIFSGPKQKLPIFSEPITLAGKAENLHNLLPKKLNFPITKFCSNPPRGSYLATLNSSGKIQAGTFVPENAVSAIGKDLKSIWENLCLENELFFQARYTQGCFCEAVRTGKIPP